MSDITPTPNGAHHGVPIELEQVSKVYDGQPQPAVDDLTMSIPAGEIVVLVGPSGCGKTTTMRLINRLIDTSSGRITIGGEDVQQRQPDELRRGIGYVIQQAGLFPHMTVAANVALVPQMLGWDKNRISERTDELLTLVGLEPGEFRERYPRQLSGGQQQRVGVARALAADPPVLLMDEPFGAVDPITRERLQDELLGLQGRLGKTIVFVTHDIDEAIKVGDRIALLTTGSRLAQYAPPSEVLANPANDYVSQFLGSGTSMKLLSLQNVSDIDLSTVVEAAADDEVATARDRIAAAHADYAIVLDENRRPSRWLALSDLGGGVSGTVGRLGEPIAESIPAEASLHEALEGLLRSTHDFVPVTGPDQEYVGVVTLSTVQQAVQDGRAGESSGGNGAGESGVQAAGDQRSGGAVV